MPFDSHKNLSYTVVATPPSPAASGTTLLLPSGHGARFPAAPFNATVWAANALPDPTNAEIVRVTAIVGDSLTIVRAQEGSTARAIVTGDQIALTVTSKILTDVEDAVSNALSVATALTAAINVVSTAVSNETSVRIVGQNALSQSLSVETAARTAGQNALSQSLSVETAARTTADNALSQAISVVSQAVSVMSQALSVEVAARNVLSQQVSVLSQQASVVSQLLSTLRGGTTGQVLKKSANADFAWSWQADLQGGVGGASATVTSNTLSVLAQQHSVLSQSHSVLSQQVSVISQLLSTLRGGLTGQVLKKSANSDFAWSWQADLQGGGGGASATVTSNALSSLSANVNAVSNAASNALSVANAASNAASIVSNALSNAISNRVSADNALSQQLSVLSNLLSALTSAHNALSNVVSDSLSIGNTASNLLSNTVSAVSVLSQLMSTLRGGTTGQVLKKSANADFAWSWQADVTGGASSATVTSNTLSIHSQAISALSQQVSAHSQQLSVHSQTLSAISQLLSTLRGGTTGQVLKKSANTDYAWSWQADQTGGASSATVTSNTLSIHSQAISVLSQQVSALSQAHSALSQAHSVLSQSLSNEISNRLSADTALSNAISNITSALNVISNALSNALSAGDVASAMGPVVALQNVDAVAVSAGAPVYGFSSALTFKLANVSVPASKAVMGLVLDDAIAVSATGRVQTYGLMSIATTKWDGVTGQTGGLAPGAVYYLDIVTGKLTTTTPSPARPVGVALSPTLMRILIAGLDAGAGGGGASATVTSQHVSVISQQLSALSQQVSVLSQAHSALSQAHSALSSLVSNLTSAHNALSNLLSNALSAGDVASNTLSIHSQQLSVVSQLLSTLRGGTTGQVLKKSANTDFAWSWQADQTGGASSATVTSNALSVLSQNISALTSVVNAISNLLSNSLSAGDIASNLLSNTVSAVSAMSARGPIVVLQNVDTSAVSAGAPVYGFTSANTFKRANVSVIASRQVIGLVIDSAIAVSATGRVQTDGVVTLTTGQWDNVTGQTGGLTTGSRYYLDSTGGLLTTSATTRPIGVALAPTVLRLMMALVDVGGGGGASGTVTSQHLSTMSQQLSVLQAAHDALSNTVSNALSAGDMVSNQLSVHSQQLSVMSQLLSTLRGGLTGQVLKKSANTDFAWSWQADLQGGGGGASATVTSNSLSVLSARVDTNSQALSVLSQLHSVLSQQVSVNAAALSNLTSAHNALSNLLSNALSAGDVASNTLSVHSQQLSVHSQQLSVLSQQVSGISQLLSTLRGGTTGQILKKSANTDFAWSWQADVTGGASSATVTSNTLSIHSQAISVLSQQVSVLSQRVSVLEVAHNALSNQVSNALSAGDVISNQLSAISQLLSTLRGGTTGQVLKKSANTDFAWSWQADATGGASSATVTSNALSVLSARIDTNSQALSVISQQLSVLSQLHSVLSQQVSVNGATLSNTLSAHNALSNLVSDTMSVVSAISARGPLVILQNVDTSTVSAGAPVYAFTSANTFKRANVSVAATKQLIGLVVDAAIAVSATGRVQTDGLVTLTTGQWDSITGQSGGLTPGSLYYLNSTTGLLTTAATARPVGVALSTTVLRLMLSLIDVAAGGGASATVTSQHVSALSQQLSVLEAAHDALSNTVSNALSAGDVVSNQLSALSQNLSVLSNALSNAISNRVSADNVLSQQISVLSQQVSVNAAALSNLTSAHNALSNLLSNALSAGDVASNTLSVHSQQLSVISQLLSTLRGGTTGQVLKKSANADFAWSWQADAGGAGSATVTSNALSVQSQQLSLLSVRIDVNSQAISVLSQQVSTLSQNVSVLSQTLSVVGDALSNEISNRTSAIDALSQLISVISQQVSALSHAVSIISAGFGAPQLRLIQQSQVVSGTSFTNVSGLSITLASAGAASPIYRVEGRVMFTLSTLTGTAFGFTYPTGVGIVTGTMTMECITSVIAAGAVNLTSANYAVGRITQAQMSTLATAQISILGGASAATYALEIYGLMRLSAGVGGTLQLQTKQSATGGGVHFLIGSYLQAFRIK